MVLRKLIAVFVVLVLASGAVFAEIAFGGTVIGKVDVVGGSSVEDSDITAGGGMGRIDASAEAESDDGSFGGFLRFRAGSYGGNVAGWGLAWWKPIEQVKFQIGNNPDGIFDTSHMTRWGFYQTAGDVGVVNPNNAWGGDTALGPVTSDYVFYGGSGDFGAFLSITPVEMLALNFMFPYADGKAEDVYKKMLAQAVVNLDGIGTFSATYQADKGYKEGDAGTGGTPAVTWYYVAAVDANGTPGTPAWTTTKPGPNDIVLDTKAVGGKEPTGVVEGYDESYGKLYASFYFSMIENLGLDLGFSFTLPKKDSDDLDPLGIGLGVEFGAGQFGIKSRILASVGGKVTVGDDTKDIPLGLTFDLLPSFAINDNLTAFLSAGIGLTAKPEDAPDGVEATVNFHVNPYVQYRFDWSKGLFAGFLLESRGSGMKDVDPVMTWSVPVGLFFTF